LATLTQADVKKFHQTHYRPNNAIIAIAGDLSQERAVTVLHKYFAAWQAAAIPATSWPEVEQPAAEQVTLNQKVSQANVLLGHIGIARSDPDYYAVQVMNYILGGGGFGSRLMDKIREELGLVYHIHSSFSARKHAGPFIISLQTKNASATQAIDESLQVVRHFIEQGPTPKDLEEAKAYLINSFPLRLVSNNDVAGLLPALEFYGLGLDYPERYPELIGQVTLEQVQAAAKAHLYPDRLLRVVVADLAQAGLERQSQPGPP
jgi:zinc protease